jgi:hypothetical protein
MCAERYKWLVGWLWLERENIVLSGDKKNRATDQSDFSVSEQSFGLPTFGVKSINA